MPLTELEPPSSLPRIQVSTCERGPNGVVWYCQVYFSFSNTRPAPLGMLNIGLRSPPPASINSTEIAGSADSRLASTQPAEPAPAMM